MTGDDIDPAKLDRPASCQASIFEKSDFARCDRCGLAWPLQAGIAGPPCRPLTRDRVVAALLREIASHEASHRTVADCVSAGRAGDPALIEAVLQKFPGAKVVGMRDGAADPLTALARAAELAGALMLLERCLGNREILDILKRLAAGK